VARKIIVAGSTNIDILLSAERLPMPGETIIGHSLQILPGGKGANQAVAAARLGARTIFLSRLGTDFFGEQAEVFLRGEGLATEHLRHSADTPTGVAVITSAKAENTIVVVPGANDHLAQADLAGLKVSKGDVLVSQFETSLDVVERFLRTGKEAGATSILNPAPARQCSAALLNLPDVIVVNETELAFFMREKQAVCASTLEAARLLRARPSQIVVVTLGSEGALAVHEGHEVRVAGRRVDAVDSSGAGDCFVGALAASFLCGAEVGASLRFANAAASICVQRAGISTSMPHLEEVLRIL
jgi:ribokinase